MILNTKPLYIAAVCLTIFSLPPIMIAFEERAHAQQSTEEPETPAPEAEWTTDTYYTKSFIVKALPDFVDTPEGGLAWEILAKTEEVPYEEKDEEGFDLMGVRPKFPDEVKAVDGKEVIIKGYMFPLEQSEKQSLFLFGPFPASCPYHYHAGPSMVIETRAKTPITFSYDPIILKGKLEIVPKDDENNVFFRLHDAEIKG